ncbi:MAG: high frequency lysogenization protein HflD [Chromatiales bacterium]|jgi:high frequency lysogenization protein
MTQASDRTLALAAVYQAATLVDSMAQTGNAESEAVSSSLYSLFQQSPASAADVYGGIEGVKLGLMALRKQLTAPDREKLQIPKYALSLLVLAGKLKKDQDTLGIISEGIQQAQEKLSLYAHDHSNQIAAMADLYRQSISNISPRIMVKGQPLFLQNPDTQNRIRALLLAGIRSAVLWKQLGGSRLQLLFSRKRIVAETEELLQQLVETPAH